MPVKRDPYSSPTQKVMELFGTLLFSGRKHSLGQLAGMLRCSKQTVLRAVEQLECSHQLEIEQWVEGREKWFKAKTPSRKPDIALDVTAIQHLALCRDFVMHVLPQSVRDEVTRTVRSTTVLLPDFDARGEALRTMGGAMPKGAIDYSGKAGVIQKLLDACRENLFCRVRYKAAGKRTARVHVVAPLMLMVYRESLYARCRLEKVSDEGELSYHSTLLAVHRMEGVKVTDRKFDAEVMAEPPESSTFGVMQGEPFRVKVRIGARAAAYVAERVWSADQKMAWENEDLLLTFTATSRPEVISWVLSFGPDASLLEPVDLRKELVDHLKGALVQYPG